jgi:5-methylcytosine-specific restriction protein A
MPSQGRRSTPLPKGWDRIRRRILRRDGWACRWDTGQGSVCGAPANQVDHKLPASQGGTDDDSNLWALCQWHHDLKTAHEASAAAHALPPRDRPAEPHPGLVDPA